MIYRPVIWVLMVALLAPISKAQIGANSNVEQAPAAGQTNSRTEFSIQIDDGLGRGVGGVNVEVYRNESQTNGEDHRLVLGRTISESNGLARGFYERSSLGRNDSFFVELSKRGYATITAGPQQSYVLPQLFNTNEVARIAKLDAFSQRTPLNELLAGELNSTNLSLDDLIFTYGKQLHDTLHFLAGTGPGVGRRAAELYALIGNPDDVRVLLARNMTPNGDPAVNRWAYSVASSLLAPTTDNEWSFLQSCAQGDFGDRWVDTAGIRTLRLLASAHSLQILQNIRELNPSRSNEIDSAIEYVKSKPAPITDPSLEKAAAKLSAALDSGLSLGNEKPRYNAERDKALIDCNFVVHGNEYIVYTATFHHVNNVWVLRGVRETRHAFLPDAPGPAKSSASK